MGRLHVRLFGRFYVGYEDEPGQPARPVRGLDARKLQECFSYLLLHRNRVFPREVLAELIAPEMSTEQSRKGLRQVLWQLQTALALATTAADPGESSEASTSTTNPDRPLVVDTEWVYVNPICPLWLDVAELDEVFGGLVGQPGEALSAEAADRVRTVIDLYRGDLLEGWYYEWCLLERERLQSGYLALLDKLMGYSTAHNEYEAGLVYGQTILGYDRASERTHQRMMKLHWLAGDRTGALRQYQACAAALQEELGVEPSRRTTELYERIAGDAPSSAQPGRHTRTHARPARGSPTLSPANGHAAPPERGTDGTPDPLVGDALRTSFLSLLHLQQRMNRQMTELGGLIDSTLSSTSSHSND